LESESSSRGQQSSGCWKMQVALLRAKRTDVIGDDAMELRKSDRGPGKLHPAARNCTERS
jgi:hypothetical protein